MGKHPRGTFIFLYLCDAIAIILTVCAVLQIKAYPPEIWVAFIIWTFLLCIARTGGVFELIGMRVITGWGTSIEVATIVILPFPLLCISMLISYVCVVAKRICRKHPEPFIGPDFNVAIIIIAAYIGGIAYEKVALLLSHSIFATIIPLIMLGLVFGSIVVLLLTTLISIDEGKRWRKVGTLTLDSLITETVLVMTGALVGRVYAFDPFLIILMLIPLLMLHNILSKLNEAKLIYIDAKTGLNNYRYFDEKIAELFDKAKSTKNPLSLVFGDMDYLRNVNNTYGHQVGDKALITIANVFKHNSPPNTVPVRFGGEEFVLIMPEYGKKQAAKAAEEIRKKIESSRIPLEKGGELQVTMSLGVATYPDDARTIEQLIKASDIAVYEAKRLGKNLVIPYAVNLCAEGEKDTNSNKDLTLS